MAVRRTYLTPDSAVPPSGLRPRRQIGVGARAIIVTDPAQVSCERRHPQPVKKQGRKMQRTTLYATIIGALAVSATAFGIGAATDLSRSLMSPVDYGDAKKAIEAEIRMAVAHCRDREGQAKDMCKAEARAEERIRKADLEAQYRGTVAAAADAKLARAKAQYDIAKARCSAERSEDKLACLRSARADKAKALNEAKLASI